MDIFTNYLREPPQWTKISNEISDQKIVEYGVPQGSVLGPILYILYMNALRNFDVEGRIITN